MTTRTDFRWAEMAVIGHMLGVRSPRHQLKKAIARKEAKQIGRGRYRVNRKRIRRRHRNGGRL
jgi:hypothetical protein